MVAKGLPQVGALMTVHNRRDQTLTCLRSLLGQIGHSADFAINVTLVDDGSTDGTSEAVSAEFGDHVTLVQGDGDLYWAGGMALAHQTATRREYDYLLWLNDDVVLDHDAISRLLECSAGIGRPGMVVGATCDPDSGQVTYAGYVREGRRLDQIVMVAPSSSHPRPVATMNGNCVLIPRPVADELGPVDRHYVHTLGDWDYGLRATSLQIPVVLAPGFVGTCSRSGDDGTWKDSNLSAISRIHLLLSQKGQPMRPHARFMRTHGGRRWPFEFFRAYLGAIHRIMSGSLFGALGPSNRNATHIQ